MIRILHVVSVLDMGGMENYIMNMYRQIDRNEMQFDFLVHHQREGFFEKEIKQLGGEVYHTSLMDDFNLLKYRRDLKQILDEHQDYSAVHGHLGSTAYWYLGEAKRHGIPMRILHGHCPGHVKSLKGDIKHCLFKMAPKYANVRLACSEEAGKYLFKEKTFEVVPNGIEIERFRFNEEKRKMMRQRLNLEDHFVVGHVGRFYEEKNHKYILRLFASLKKRLPGAKLLLLGTGAKMDEIRELSKQLNVEDSVIFAGLISDTAPYYQAMDAFIMPSIYEGLPLAGVEAQCASLPCLFSNTVSSAVKMSPPVWFLGIEDGDIPKWVDQLVKISENRLIRNGFSTELLKFDVRTGTQQMIQRYSNGVKD